MTECNITTRFLDSDHPVYRVRNTGNGRYVDMPPKEAFEYIRFRIVNRSNRLSDAYQMAGDIYSNIVPGADILPCIKNIYTDFKDQYTADRQLTFREYGDWVFQEACNCIQSASPSGRIDLGYGFIVPGGDEKACITTSMLQERHTFSYALSQCAPDLFYPNSVIQFIEDQIVRTQFPFYNIIRNARTKYLSENILKARVDLGDGLVVPSYDEIMEISFGVINQKISLEDAYFNIANDILPPEKYRECIRGKITTSKDSWLNIFQDCRTAVSTPQGSGNKAIIYGGIAVLALLAFRSR